tara:strand:+ start:33 stop:1271 length:1239 start_codon:yes stop_codon:yes gene_type:complete
MGKGNNGLTSNHMYRLLTGPKRKYQLTTERLMSEFYRSSMSTSTDGTFKAVCLSGIKTGEGEGSGDDVNDASVEGVFIDIIVRPLTPFGDILPDPRLSTDPNDINDVITIHKTMWAAKSDFGFKSTSAVSFGQVINCYFENGSIGNSDFSGLRFAEPQGLIFDPSFVALATIEGVMTGLTAFEAGFASRLGSFPQSATPASNQEINDLAGRFDNEPSVNKKRNQWHIVRAHPEFQNYIKAFITKCKDNKIAIQLNSTHRDRAHQDRLLREHAEDKAKGIVRPAPGKTSYHLVGLAFDFNPIINGKKMHSSRPKGEWIQTGIPAIGESLGLRWGGHFSKNYDPIHFDLEKKVSRSRMKIMIADAKIKGVEGTMIPTGMRLSNEQLGESAETPATSEQGESVNPYGSSDTSSDI